MPMWRCLTFEPVKTPGLLGFEHDHAEQDDALMMDGCDDPRRCAAIQVQNGLRGKGSQSLRVHAKQQWGVHRSCCARPATPGVAYSVRGTTIDVAHELQCRYAVGLEIKKNWSRLPVVTCDLERYTPSLRLPGARPAVACQPVAPALTGVRGRSS